jgi:hypothetical protein
MESRRPRAFCGTGRASRLLPFIPAEWFETMTKPSPSRFDPLESLANMRHEFGEHGGVNMSIEASTTFTVLEAGSLPRLFRGEIGPDSGSPETGGCYLYGRHFNPTVYVLGRELAALEGTAAAYCTASGMGAVSSVLMQCWPLNRVERPRQGATTEEWREGEQDHRVPQDHGSSRFRWFGMESILGDPIGWRHARTRLLPSNGVP